MKLKKVLAGTLAAAMTFMCIVQSFSAADVIIDESDIDYEIRVKDGESYVAVTGYHGREEDFVIPEEIGGLTVKEVVLDYWYYKYCKTMEIPSTVDNITYGTRGSYTSSPIEEIKVDENNTRYMAVNGVLYIKLRDNYLANPPTYYPATLISYPPAKKDEAYVIPATVSRIADAGATGSYGGGGQALINDYLKEITLPAAMVKVRSSSNSKFVLWELSTNHFQYLDNLEAIHVAENNADYYSKDGVLFTKDNETDKTMLMLYPEAKPDESYTVPEGVQIIGDFAFGGNDNLLSISFPASVESGIKVYSDNLAEIHVDAGNQYYATNSENSALFNKDMTELIEHAHGSANTSFEIPEGVITIGSSAFNNSDNLTAVTIPDTVTTIKDSAFSGMDSLTSIAIPDSVTEMGIMSVFYRCTSLSDVTIGRGLTEICLRCFWDCTALTEIDIPDNITVINYNAFGNTGLTSVTIPESVVTLYGFNDCKNLESIVVPKSVTTLGDFNGCINLKEVTLQEGLNVIDAGAFGFCTSLESIIIPEGVTMIGRGAFNRCASLKSATIPESVTFIGTPSAYEGMPGTEYGIFDECPDDLMVYGVPGSYVEGYCERFHYNFNDINNAVEDVTLADEETGISVISEDGAIKEGTELKVEPIETEDGTVRYDISLIDENGEETQPIGGRSVTVRIPVPAGMDAGKCKIYHAEEQTDGTIVYKSMEVTVVTIDGTVYLEFTTDHFSEYVITEKELGTKPGDGDGDEDPEPGTGSGDEDPEPGTGSGSEEPEPGTGSGDEDPEPGTGSGSEEPEPGTGSGDEDPEPGTGSGDEDPEPGTGSGDEDPEPGTGSGSEEPVVTTLPPGAFLVPETTASESTTQPPAAAETTTTAEAAAATTTTTTAATTTAAITDSAAPTATTSDANSTVSAPASEPDSASNVGNAGDGAQADKNVNTGFVLAFIPAAAAAAGVIIAKKRK